MIRTSIFQATGVNGWAQSSPFVGMSITTRLPAQVAIDGGYSWEPLPGSSPDRIQWGEKQRSVQFVPTQSEPRAWMLATFQVPAHCIGVIESISSLLEIDALDEVGIPISSWRLDGQEWTQGQLIHPDPAQGTLRIRWELRQDSINYWTPILGINNANGDALPGSDLVSPWRDDLFGWNAPSRRMQIVVPDATRQTLWAIIEVDEPRWFVKSKGRLSGYFQQRSGRDSAGDSARVRS